MALVRRPFFASESIVLANGVAVTYTLQTYAKGEIALHRSVEDHPIHFIIPNLQDPELIAIRDLINAKLGVA